MQLRALILPIAIFIALLLYWPARDYGIVTDYLGWLNKYKEQGWSGILNSFNYPGLHHFFHLVNFTIYKVTGASSFGLYLIFSVFHGVASYAVYRFLRKAANFYNFDQGTLIAFFAAVAFLFSPYQAEVVTWKACLHYMLVTLLFCLSGIQYINYLSTGHVKSLGIHLVLFVLALFTIEIALVFPGILSLLGLGYYWYYGEKPKLNSALKVMGIHTLMLVLYFTLNKVIIGDIVGHYGAEQHLNFSPALISSTFSKYVLKYVFLLHFFPYDIKSVVYGYMEGTWGLVFSLVTIGLVVWMIYYARKSKVALFMSWTFLSFFLGLLPILNLFFVDLHLYENDRYGYLASFFIYGFFIACIFTGIRKLKYITSIALILLFAYFTVKLVGKIRYAAQELKEIVASMPFCDEKGPIYIAGVPENHHGIYMLRDLDEFGLGLKETSLHWLNKECQADLHVFSKYNMSDTNGAHIDVRYLDDGRLRVWNIMDGSWLWHRGLGISSYTTDYYKVIEEEGHFYVEFHRGGRPPIYYLEGTDWKKVN